MVKKILTGGIIVIAIGFLIYIYSYPARPTLGVVSQPQGALSVEGVIQTVNQNQETVTVLSSENVKLTIKLSTTTEINDNEGRSIQSSALEPGMDIRVIGEAPDSFTMNAANILIARDARDSWDVQPDTLFPNSIIPTSYSITGLAKRDWFENTGYFVVKVLDSNGTLEMQSRAYEQSSATDTAMLPFTAWLSFDPPHTATGTIIFEKSPLAATATPPIIIPVRFATQAGTIAVQLYYPNTRKIDPTSSSCNIESLLPIVRNIPITHSLIQATITQLLTGSLTEDEKLQGFTSEFSFNNFSLASSMLDAHGTLTLTFTTDQSLNDQDTCDRALLVTQIEKTAEQFPSVKKVVLLPQELFATQ